MAVNQVVDFPWEGEYSAESVAGFLANSAEVFGYTKAFYEVRRPDGALILGAGVAVWSFARAPEMWIMLAKPYFENLRESLRVTRDALSLPAEVFPHLTCEVKKTSAKELHFVKHMGWVPTGEPSIRPNGHNYIPFRVS